MVSITSITGAQSETLTGTDSTGDREEDAAGGSEAAQGSNSSPTLPMTTGEPELETTGSTTGLPEDSSGDGAIPGGCPADALCDDFEEGFDPRWRIQADSVPAPALDAQVANGPGQSARFEGTSNQSFLVADVPAQAFYVRVYLNLNREADTAHGWYIVGADNETSGAGNQIRFGQSTNYSNGEYNIDLNVYGSPEYSQFSNGTSNGANIYSQEPGVVFENNVWYCVETFFNGPGDEFQVWIDGQELTGLHVTADTMFPGWPPTYTVIKIGAGAGGDVGTAWFDDVAIATSRIGC